MKKVSIIMVNYNGERYIGRNDLCEAINSFLKTDHAGIEFIFVDNNSDDDSIHCVEKLFRNNRNIPTKIVRNSENKGFAGGCIEAIKQAKGEYICLVNNDDKAINVNWLTKLVDVLESDDKIGAAFSKKVKWDDEKIIDAAGLTMNPAGFITQIGFAEKDCGQYDNIKECLIWQTAVLFRKSIFDKIGGLFDENYIILNDDTDSSLRILISGYKIIYVPASVVSHKRSATMKHMPIDFVAFHGRKNTIQTLIKNYELKNLLIWLPITLFIYLSSIFYYMIIKRPDQAKATSKAIFWNFKYIKNIIKKRKIIQKKVRKVKDKVIMHHMVAFNPKKIIMGEKVWPK